MKAKTNSAPVEATKAQHTKGEWIYVPFENADGKFIYARIQTKEKSVAFANVYLDHHIGKQEAEANAKRIVKAVNMHDELIECIKASDKEIKRTGGHLSPLGIRIQSLLQQAEQE